MKTEGMHQKLDENNETKQRLFEKKTRKSNGKLQMTPEKTKISSWISEKQTKQKLDTDETSF